ncbi:peptidase S10 serine carboxypeptidase [mine drainage metagenome]|uniref:Peptidase S10 serine carboxypeptidase n=1 Tax=mine drainage metagenome TaxID=410659 RepID=T1CF59_9ZZZZ
MVINGSEEAVRKVRTPSFASSRGVAMKNAMKSITRQTLLAALLIVATPLLAPVARAAAKPAIATAAKAARPVLLPIPKPRAVVTHHSVVIAGQRIDYTATAGTLLLYDAKHQATASVFYIAYTKDGVHDPARRPITFAYNGRPGLRFGAGGYRWFWSTPAGVAGTG